jgi:CHAT domain-containing protein/tetratricopeptide (TPR) repeat protein
MWTGRAIIVCLAGSAALPALACTSPLLGPRYDVTAEDLNVAVRRGEGRQALTYYEQTADALLATGDRNRALRALSAAMSMAWRTGELQHGLRIADRAVKLLAEPPADVPPSLRSDVLDLIGSVHLHVGLIDDAEKYYKEGLAGASSSKYWMATFHRQLGNTAILRRNYAAARTDLAKAIELYSGLLSASLRREFSGSREDDGFSAGSLRRAVSMRRDLARSLITLARLEASSAPTAAERMLQDAFRLARWIGYADEEIGALRGLATIALQQGAYANAEAFLDDALSIATKAQHDTSLVWLTFTRGRLYEARGRLDEAAREFQRSMDILESTRARLDQSTSRTTFVEDKQVIYHQAILLALRRDRPVEAFALAERSRGRALLDLLGTNASLTRPRNAALVANESSVRLDVARAATEDAASRLASETPKKVSAVRDLAISNYDHFVWRVRREDPEQAALLTVETLSVEDAQALLPADTALVEYLVTPSKTVAWVIHRDSLVTVEMAISQDRLNGRVRAFREAIASRSDLESVVEMGQELYSSIFDAVSKHLRSRRVIVVPHDVLHYLPFSALRTARNRWLVEEYTISTMPSASAMKFLSGKGATAPNTVLAVGNPILSAARQLPFAELEAQMVRRHFAQGIVLLGNEATRRNVISRAHTAGLIHFATHGQLREDDPLSSALLLTPEGEENGRLEVREIFRLDLNARLVVLSACETGLGALSRGDDLMGLQRAFLYAGTPAVISTLWKVDDQATYEIMRSFYEALRTQTVVEALRHAQRSALAEYSHPFAWAPFSLTGMP